MERKFSSSGPASRWGQSITDRRLHISSKVTQGPSSKTSYVVIGDNAGAGKLAVVEKNKLKKLDEDGFLDLIRTRGAGELDESAKKKIAAEEKKIKEIAKELGPPKSADPG